MGRSDSEKLNPGLGAKRYGFEEQRKYLFGPSEELRLGSDVVLVLHGTGSMFGSIGRTRTASASASARQNKRRKNYKFNFNRRTPSLV
jgi:hypothetical protein